MILCVGLEVAKATTVTRAVKLEVTEQVFGRVGTDLQEEVAAVELQVPLSNVAERTLGPKVRLELVRWPDREGGGEASKMRDNRDASVRGRIP
jgi:hypothetical protein